MNIENKFRAWDKLNSKMFYHTEDNKLMIPCSLGVLWLNPYIKDNNYVIKKEHFIISQYIGLKDIIGKEIYEGDILKHHGQVIWTNEGSRWSAIDLNWNDKKEVHDIDYLTSPYEVIGNIYEK